jgi:hypothetical protein
MKRILKWLGLPLAVIFLSLQLFNPPRTNPPVKTDFLASMNPPKTITDNFVAACYDCHSYQTKWPWYAHVAPMSWLIVNDVNEGRANLNLSEWPAGDAKRAARRLENMSEKIDNNEMPPKKYTAIHVNARLTDEQKKAMTDWLDGEAEKLKSAAK